MQHPPLERLASQHDRKSFNCGSEPLDRYLREQARKEQDRSISVCWVLPGKDNPAEIRAFYTLSAYSIRLADLPPESARKLPRYPDVPAALLGRLAVATKHQGLRIGEHMLLDACARVLEMGSRVAAYALVVDAKDQQAASFYARYDFICFPAHPLRLFLPMETIRRLFASK